MLSLKTFKTPSKYCAKHCDNSERRDRLIQIPVVIQPHFFHSEPSGGLTVTGAFFTSFQSVLKVVPPLSE